MWLPKAKDGEVRIVEEMIDLSGTGQPVKVRVFLPKNRLITREQRIRAEREFNLSNRRQDNGKSLT